MPKSRLPQVLVVVVALVAAIVGLVHGIPGWPDCTTHLRDDAFYEFAWAANLATGRGPTVSDGVTTSGVQYLWCLLLALPALWRPASLPEIAVGLGLVCHVVAAASWVRHGRGRGGAWAVGLLWLGNPLLLRECQNGQETALAALLLALLWQQRAATERRFAALALLTMLARSDLFAVILLLSWWRHRPTPARGLRVPAAVLLVHLLLNRWLGGGWLQDSGAPMAWLFHANFELTAPDLGDTLRQWWWYLRPVLLGGPFGQASAAGLGVVGFLLLRPCWPHRWRALPALLVGCASAAGMRDLATPGWAALLLFLFPASAPLRVRRDLAALAVGVLALIALHWAVRWYPRDYYAVPLVVVAAAGLLQVRRASALLVLVGLVQAWDFRRVPLEPLAGQAEMELAARHLHALLPPGERIGSFNAGLLAFWTRYGDEPGPAIVNLDGVVDARALAALRQARLQEFLDRQGIRFLLDNAVQFTLDPRVPHANGPWFGPGFDPERDLVEVARFDVPQVDAGRPGTDGFRLYWRRRAGTPPPLLAVAKDLGPLPRHQRAIAWPARRGQVLELEVDGRRTPVVTATADALWVVAVPMHPGARLFEGAASQPLLTLPGSSE